MVSPRASGVVLIPFPFSDLSGSKLRPALVLADVSAGDWVLCQITSQRYTDNKAIELNDSDCDQGGLKTTSYARPGKLFTANVTLMKGQVAVLKKVKHDEIVQAIEAMLQAGKL